MNQFEMDQKVQECLRQFGFLCHTHTYTVRVHGHGKRPNEDFTRVETVVEAEDETVATQAVMIADILNDEGIQCTLNYSLAHERVNCPCQIYIVWPSEHKSGECNNLINPGF